MQPPSSLDRRGFLRRGLQLGAVATGAILAPALLEGCANPRERAFSTTTTVLEPATAVQWDALGRSLTGQLVQPADPGYGVDRLLYNSKFADLHPRAIALCATSADVMRCVEFARSHVVRVAVRSGGHSYGGYSSGSGLVIDVGALNQIVVDPRANTATVGAGAQLIDVYNALARYQRLLPSGSCPTVGIAGLALGGGIGVFGRKYGLTSDNLRSATFVTADADLITASDASHHDLLWASQGGGGGNFAIATSMVFDVHLTPSLALFTLHYPWSAATTALDAWQHWIGGTPDELWSNFLLLSQGTSGLLVEISGVLCGSEVELSSLVNLLIASIGAPAYQFVGSDDYLSAMRAEAGCSNLTVAACHLSAPGLHGVLSRSAFSAKSSYVTSTMSAPRVRQFVDAVSELSTQAPTLGGALAFDAYGGAINRIAAEQTAFVHRDKLAGIQATFSWSSSTSPSARAAGQDWLTWLGSSVLDPSAGAYQNYIDPTLSNWLEAYYGTNLTRLSEVKRTYDPEDFFSFAQSIPVAP